MSVILPRGKGIPHDSALSHVSGESEFIDDRPPVRGELYLGVVMSTRAHARIRRIDASAALRLPGVVGVYTHQDVAHNLWGTIFQDQPLLVDGVTQFYGESVAVVACDRRELVAQAKGLVRVEYDDLPPILSIEAARKQRSFIGPSRKIVRGDVDAALKGSPHRLRGKIIIQGADHFYLESQASIAYPAEGGRVEIHSSSQHPTEVQHVAAHALGIPDNDVVCVVKRMGGAFGGKESQAAPYAALAALVAHRTGRAARLVLGKDEDMIMTGKRNPFEIEYDVAFTSEGRILGLDAQLFSDGGAYADLSTAIMERAMLHSDNAYYLPAARITGQVCKTHFHPHTAFRGFGGPKGVAMIENAIEEIARFLGKDALDIRKLNCYGDGERSITPYGQVLENNLLPQLFESLEKKTEYRKRRREIAEFNRGSRTHAKGLSLTAVKFGISFTTRFLNQGNALVNVHRDGTLQVSTGATEMGQGVNTRISAIVAEAFGLAPSDVRIMPTSTEKNHNTSPTAASSGADLNGAAALAASRKILGRLAALALRVFDIPAEKRAVHTAAPGTAPEVELGEDAVDGSALERVRFEGGFVFDHRDPKRRIAFTDLVREAYLNRVALGDYAFYKIPGIQYDKVQGKGTPFFYFTQGVAASEVLIDRCTGELKVTRVDILMDLGRPISIGIDRGQVTGAFVQGMGWVTTENLFYSPEGKLISHSPSTYKIPSVQDTPRVFNVDLMENLGNTKSVRGSKAVGEPPLLLALSVWTAAKDAIASARASHSGSDSGVGALPPRIKIPATNEEILLALAGRRNAPADAVK